MKINEILIAERKKHKMSQRALAIKAQISNTTISRIEAGEVIPDTATIEKLSKALKIDISYLLGKDIEIPRPLIIPENLQEARVAFYGGVEGLSQEDIDKVAEYIEFLKSKGQ